MSTNNNKKVLSLIEQLVKMSGIKDDQSTLEIEKESLEQELAQARASLESLKTLISPERYFNANEAIVNNAIESSLMRRNSALELEIKAKQSKIEEIKKSLADLAERKAENRENMSRSMRCIEALSLRINESPNLDEKTLSHYESMVAKTRGGLTVFEGVDSKLDDQIAKLQDEIEQIETEIKNIQTIIDTNNSYLSSTKNSSLESDSQGNALKSRDEKEVKMLEDKIASLEAKRVELLENPILLAAKAKKELQEDNDVTTLISLIRKLVACVAEKEYMEIPYSETFENDMKELLATAEADRNEFASAIDSKSYKSDNTELDMRRKEHLEGRIRFYQESIATIRDIINQIDQEGGLNNNTQVEDVERSIAEMEKTLADYTAIEPSAQLKKSEIIAASNKKEQQIEAAKDLLAAYQSDVIADVSLAAQFETKSISSLELAIANAQAELNAIDIRLNLQKNAPEDFVAKAMDEAKLKELAAKVIAIKYRIKFKESPSQILDEIEDLLGTKLEPVEVEQVVEATPKAPHLDLSALEDTLQEDTLKVDHILDLAPSIEPIEVEEPQVNNVITFEPVEVSQPTFQPVDVNQTSFEPITPIELDTYTPAAPTTIEMNEKTVEPDEVVRGHKVVDITPIEVTEEQKMELNQNPFASNTEEHLFDFNGNLLTTDEPDLIDFDTAVAEVNTLGLGRAA